MLVLLSLILIAALSVATYSRFRKRQVIYAWKNALSLDKHSITYQTLYHDVDGFALSRLAREHQDAMEYVYGEINFESFIALLSLCKPNASTIFYDLGSGIGKAVVACALVFDVKKSCGIEIFANLHECAVSRQKQLSALSDYHDKAERIEFISGNFLEQTINDASLVFINATAFFGDLWYHLSAHLEQLQPGSVVISTSKALVSSKFLVTKITVVQMSWGPVQTFIQERQYDK